MSKWIPDLFEISRRTRATQQWVRYISNWTIALNALRQLWETGKVSELKSRFWESPQKPVNQ
jgi:hypothetical protein